MKIFAISGKSSRVIKVRGGALLKHDPGKVIRVKGQSPRIIHVRGGSR